MGDEESRFIRICEAGTDDEPVENIKLEPDKVYDVYVLFDNSSENGIAKDVNVQVDISKEIHSIFATIRSSNTNPEKIVSKITLDYDEHNYELVYFKDNIKFVSDWPINGTSIDHKKIFGKDGTLIGVRKPDGRLPAGVEYSGYIVFQIGITPCKI